MFKESESGFSLGVDRKVSSSWCYLKFTMALLVILGWLLAVAEAGLWEKQLLEDLGIESNYNSMERPVHNENHSVPLQIHLE